jgi:hypothetical protein
MKTAMRILLGLAFWCALGWTLYRAGWGVAEDRAQSARWVEQIRQYSAGARTELHLHLPASRELAVGDPIFIELPDGTLRQVGQISALQQGAQTLAARQAVVREAQAVLYPSAPPLSERVELTYVATPDSLTWVVQTLLPPEKRTEIAGELSAAFEAHRGEILTALRPVAEQSVRDALAVIEQDLPPALARHRPKLEAIGARYHQDIVEKEVVPLVQDEIWPIVRWHGEPAATEVGQEMWARVSLWRFGWRYLYDRSLLPEKHLTQQEFRRFVDDEAMPLLEAHSDDFLAAIENSLKDTARNPRVRAALRRNLVKIMEDPELQAVLGNIFREVIVDNPRLREALQRNWSSPQAQAAFQLAAQRFEPTVRRIGDLVFGTPEEGISPEFAAVLRNQILHKDRRWLLLSDLSPQDATSQPPARRMAQVKFPARDVPPRMLGGSLPRPGDRG